MKPLKQPPILDHCVEIDQTSEKIKYQGVVVKKDDKFITQCIILLSGTSTQLADISYFLNCLKERGYSVAAIERFIGGLFDIRVKPEFERKAALKDFIHQLTENHRIQKFHVIAHSYASFEVIRLLIDDPITYRKYIENIIFINPAGFNDALRFFSHCLRFTFIFIFKEYLRVFFSLFKASGNDDFLKTFYKKKFHATTSLFFKTLQNPARTFKEVADIVSFKIKPHMQTLIEEYGYNFHVALNTDDELVPVAATLHQLIGVLAEKRIMRFPGNHMDLLINDKQIRLFLDHLDKIVGTTCWMQ